MTETTASFPRASADEEKTTSSMLSLASSEGQMNTTSSMLSLTSSKGQMNYVTLTLKGCFMPGVSDARPGCPINSDKAILAVLP